MHGPFYTRRLERRLGKLMRLSYPQDEETLRVAMWNQVTSLSPNPWRIC